MSRGIHSCAPEAPSTITVTVNTLEVDGTKAYWVEQYLTGAQYKAIGYIPLEYVPYTRSQASLMLNTGVMRQVYDFAISGDKVYLTFTPQDDDKLHFKYLALTDGTSNILNDSSLAVGSMIGCGGTIPTGWLEMDGATSHANAAYPALVVWLTANPTYALSNDGTNFVLKSLSTPYYDGTTLVTGKTIIKY